jgi:putative (di)nucleoside polyphosphate hydrolase
VIDTNGFRPNVGLIIFNADGKLLWAKRIGQDAWQFPQGGIQHRETPQAAALRELREEVGLDPVDVEIVASTNRWLRYRLPPHLVRQRSHPVCIGQKQRWFLLRLVGDSSRIRFDLGDKPEFEDVRWIDYWEGVEQVVQFKRNVYRKALTELQGFFAKALQAPDAAVALPSMAPTAMAPTTMTSTTMTSTAMTSTTMAPTTTGMAEHVG